MISRSRSFIKGFIYRMMPAVIISHIARYFCTTVDTAITGKFLGDTAVAAEGFVTPIIMLVVALAGVMAAGNSIICSNESGKGDVEEINRTFSTTLTVSLIMSVAVTAVVLIFSRQICLFMGLKEGTELFAMTHQYMCGYVPLMPGLTVIMILPGLLNIEGDNKTGIIATSIAFVLDIVFDILNVTVIHGGVLGMALATTISYYIALTVMVILYLGKKHVVRFSLKYVDLKRVVKVLPYGTPTMVNNLCMGVITGVVNAMLLKYGSEDYVAAFTIIYRIGMLLLCFVTGMGELTSVVTGIVNGEEDRKGLKEILTVFFRLTTAVSIALIVIVFLIGGLPAKLFTSDTAVTDIAGVGLKIFSLHLLFRSILICYVGYLRGIRKYMIGNILLIVFAALCSLAASVLPVFFGVNGVWFCYTAGSFLAVVIVLVYIGATTSRSPFSFDAATLKSSDYGIDEQDYKEEMIGSVEHLCCFSRESSAFVKSHGGDDKQAHAIALCIEEMGKNIINYAFEGKKKDMMSVKLMFTDDMFRLRFRDNGRHFNPDEFRDMQSGGGSVNNFGIRMVYGVASEVTYLNTMHYNNLLIKI